MMSISFAAAAASSRHDATKGAVTPTGTNVKSVETIKEEPSEAVLASSAHPASATAVDGDGAFCSSLSLSLNPRLEFPGVFRLHII